MLMQSIHGLLVALTIQTWKLSSALRSEHCSPVFASYLNRALFGYSIQLCEVFCIILVAAGSNMYITRQTRPQNDCE